VATMPDSETRKPVPIIIGANGGSAMFCVGAPRLP
jgi:hypothetical protein